MNITITKLPKLKEEKIREINEAFEKAAAPLVQNYPPTEQLTWAAQRQDALAWQKDPNADTPYLDDLAIERNLTREDMLTRTLNQVLYFQQQSKQLSGKRQRLVDQVNQANDAADLDNISWDE